MNLLYIFIAVMLILGALFSMYCAKYKGEKTVKGVLLVVIGIFPSIFGIGLFPATMWRNIAVVLIGGGVVFIVLGIVFIIRGLCVKR